MLALALSAPGALAAAPPKLTVSKTSVGRAAGMPGTRFVATVSVLNRGRAKAPASTVGFYLSANARRDRRDRALGGRAKVPALAPHRQARRPARLTVPRRDAAGRRRRDAVPRRPRGRRPARARRPAAAGAGEAGRPHEKAFAFALARASERCVQNKDPYQALRMIGMERERQMLGQEPDPTVFERAARCWRFELQVDFRFGFDYDDGPLREGVDEGRLVFLVEPNLEDLGMPAADAPTAVPQLTAATWGPDTAEAHWAWSGAAEVTAPAAVRRLEIGYRPPTDDGEPVAPTVVLGLDWGALVEQGTFTVCDENGCQSTGDGSPGTYMNAMLALYVGDAGKDGQTEIRDWTPQAGTGNEVFATKDRERSRTVQGGTGHETLHLRLLHKPLP